MAKTSGGNRGGGKKNDFSKVEVNDVKQGLMTYAREYQGRYGTLSPKDYNSDAQRVIDVVADGNFGFASQVATSVKNSGYRISEKQAYVIARATIENKVKQIFNKNGQLNDIFKKRPKRGTDEYSGYMEEISLWRKQVVE